MAINLSQAFHRTAPAPIDDSLVLSKAEMLAVNDNLMPAKYFAICSDDGGIYLYDKAAEPSAETGKYTKFEGGGGGETGGGSLPIGALLPMTGNAAPRNCLVCDGTVYNIADYPLLAAYYKSSLGSANFYGGDGTTTFAVPDLRGEFIRGTGTNSHGGLSGDGANVGVHQKPTTAMFINENTYENDTLSIWLTGTYEYLTGVFDKSVNGNIRKKITPEAHTPDENISYGSVRPTNTSVLYCVVAKRSEDEEIGSARVLFEYDPDTESKTGTEIAQEFLSIVNSLSPNQRFTIGWALNDGGMYLYQNDITSGDYAGGYGLSCAQIEKSGNENMKYLYVTPTAIVYEVYKLARTNNSITYQQASVNMSSKFTAKLKIVDISGGAGSFTNYSTNEQRVGTWIDGKPVYQKTFNETVTAYSDGGYRRMFISAPISDAETLVSCDNSYIDSSSGTWSWNNPTFMSSNDAKGCVLQRNVFAFTDPSNHQLTVRHQSDINQNITSVTFLCTVRYTKTTD